MYAVHVALTHAYQSNIDRYRRLLRTRLTDLERDFIERRMAEEFAALKEMRQRSPALVRRPPPPGTHREPRPVAAEIIGVPGSDPALAV